MTPTTTNTIETSLEFADDETWIKQFPTVTELTCDVHRPHLTSLVALWRGAKVPYHIAKTSSYIQSRKIRKMDCIYMPVERLSREANIT